VHILPHFENPLWESKTTWETLENATKRMTPLRNFLLRMNAQINTKVHKEVKRKKVDGYFVLNVC
jgi:hypothetical protein